MPVGVFLSGGLDSTFTAVRHARRLIGRPIPGVETASSAAASSIWMSSGWGGAGGGACGGGGGGVGVGGAG